MYYETEASRGSGTFLKPIFSKEDTYMSCFNVGGGNCCWIIILILILFCVCGNGNNNMSDSGCGCGCNNNPCC